MKTNQFITKSIFFLIVLLSFCLIFPLFGADAEVEDKDAADKDKEEEKLPVILEEVEVTAQVPAQQPISTVSLIETPVLKKTTPKHLGEVMNYTTGTYVTEGGKGESSVMIRGISRNRITLMYDGIPIAEPYFNSFDLKTFASSGVDDIKVIKGAGSVLYGPNTLGGIINVVTHRPTRPFLSINANLAGDDTYFVSGSAGYAGNRFSIFTNAAWDQSNGFRWSDSGDSTLRAASDYDRKNFTGKFYFYPNKESEVMAEVIYYTAHYGIPAALDYFKVRHWRFKDWDRLQVNLGGVFPLLNRGTLKTRFYYIYHYNVLDAYRTDTYQELSWESTYKNHSYGAFVMGQMPIFKNNELRLSINLNRYRMRQQGDIGEEWEKYNRDIYSLGIEDHLNISPQWKLIAGASIDYLKKHSGETRTTLNPILGVRFSPRQWLSFHLSMARKSRFPSMRSLYSSRDGNPDLRDEIGRLVELGFTYKRSISVSGAVFYNYFEDMIQTYRGLDGYKTYQNVGRAEIFGFELEVRKKMGIFDMNLNYTYLDARDKDSDSPLDYNPTSQLNMILNIGAIKGFSFSLWGVVVSESEVKMGKAPPFEVLQVPGYATFHARLEKKIGMVTLYVKGENILDKEYYTEPGYPMKARTFSLGFDFHLE